MCGRFTLRTPTKAVVEAFGLTEAFDFKPCYNIAPTQQVAAIRLDAATCTRQLSLLRWGLVQDGKEKATVLRAAQRRRAVRLCWTVEHWHRGDQTIDSATIITTEPNELMESIHDRMPVNLSPDDYELWLEPDFHGLGKLLEMLKPYLAEDMEAYPISTLVNNPRNEDAKCVEAVR